MPDDDFTERFTAAHDHLDQADELLAELARDIEADLSELLAQNGPSVEYDLNAAAVTAELPLDRVVGKLNQALEPPMLAERDRNTIRVFDVRDEYDIPGDWLERDDPKDVVRRLQDQTTHGAPESKVKAFLTAMGFNADREIEHLKTEGEIYEPHTNYLRVI